MPSSVAIAHSVATEGDARPRSICEMRLGETSIRAASLRPVSPAAWRSCRILAPRVPETVISRFCRCAAAPWTDYTAATLVELDRTRVSIMRNVIKQKERDGR